MKKKHARALSKARSKAYAELEARTKRIQEMKNAEAHLVTENIVASKGRKRKIKGAEDGKPAVYICENQTCQQPEVSTEKIRELLGK